MSEVDLQSVKNRFGIIGNSEVMDRALAVALRVAPTNLSVLVTGESGVGKEFFPQIIHSYSARKHNKYIAVNCGAIPEGTIDSELSVTRRALLRVLLRLVRVSLRRLMVAQSSLMRWVSCHWLRRCVCSECCSRASICVSARHRCVRPM